MDITKRKKTLLILGIGVFLMILSTFLSIQYESESQIMTWLQDIGKTIEENRKELVQEVEKKNVITCLGSQKMKMNDCARDIRPLPFQSIIIFKDNKRVYWSDPYIPQPNHNERVKHTSYYWKNGNLYLLDVLPKETHTIYLIHSLEDYISYAKEEWKRNISLTKEATSIPFLVGDKIAGYFQVDKAAVLTTNSNIAGWIYLLSVTLLLFGTYLFVFPLSKELLPEYHLPITAGSMLLVRICTTFFNVSHYNIDSLLFDPIFSQSQLSQSLGDFLLNIVLFYVLLILFIKHKKVEEFKLNAHHSFVPYAYMALTYFIILFNIFFITYVCRQIMFFTPLGLNLESTEIWKPISFLSLSGIIVLITGHFQLSDYLSRVSHQLQFSLGRKMIGLCIACVLSLGVFKLLPLHIHPFPIYLVGILYILLMDLFTEIKQPQFNWLFLWVAILAAGTTSVLFKYFQDSLSEAQIQLVKKNKYNSHLNIYDDDYNPVGHNHVDYAEYEKGLRKKYTGLNYPLHLSLEEFPPVRVLKKIKTDTRIEYIYRPDKDTTLISGRRKSDLTQPLGWYAYLFVLWLIFATLISFINTRIPWLPPEWNFYVNQLPSFRRRIQMNILGITITSFIILSLVTYFYIQYSTQDQIKAELLSRLSILRDDINQQIANKSNMSSMRLSQIIEQRANLHRLRPLVFDEEGDRLDGYQDFLLNWTRIPYRVYNTLFQDGKNDIITLEDDQQLAFSQINLGKGVSGIIGLTNTTAHIAPDFSTGQLLNTLLKIYLFLGVLACIISVFVSHSITQPLKDIGKRLTEFKLGGKNEPIEWKNPDELGELINNYNLMIKELEESAQILAANERETAWREMAKQVAHEIKNPLTPMKLSIQHLEIALQEDPEEHRELSLRVTKTLIEQIDNLTQIASEFSNFAKMPQPKNQKSILNDIVTSVHDLFRERDDMEFRLKVPIDEIWVFADKNHLVRIMNNLIKNAIQAIPTEKRGEIDILLYKENGNAIVSVTDNGTGIPIEIRDKIFKPNFTSKSSGTGLGLAICSNLAEGFNGRIFFETEVNTGTTFFLEIPLMRTGDNFEDENRVIL